MYRNADEIEKLKKIKADSDQEMAGALKQLKELSESQDSMQWELVVLREIRDAAQEVAEAMEILEGNEGEPLSVAEPPELSRLKCAGHHHKGNTDSNALQTEQFLVCRVTSWYNHRISDRTSIPCTKASPEISQPYILQHRHSSYFNKFKTLLQIQT